MGADRTPKDVLLRDGPAQLYRFRPSGGLAPKMRAPVLLVPSMINRWYVLDMHERASLVSGLLRRGHDVFCVDWGAPSAEDRYLTWDDVLERLGRMMARVRRVTRAGEVGLLGYCMGGTLAGIWTALHPTRVAALVNLAGPFDFAEAGLMATMTDPRWFDAGAITAAGNVEPMQMQSGFVALRPTAQVAKWIGLADRGHDPRARQVFHTVEQWVTDNVAFPAAAYETYIRELYQDNALVRGEHFVRGRRVDLGAVSCPLLTIGAEQDVIVPMASARGLHDRAGSKDRELVVVPGGHVGAVIGSKAERTLYPLIAEWLERKLCNSTN